MVYTSYPIGSITAQSIDHFRSGLNKVDQAPYACGGYDKIKEMDGKLNLYIFYSSSDGKNRFNVFDNEEHAQLEMKRMKEDSSVELPELNQDVLVGRLRTMFDSEFGENNPILEKLKVFLPKIQDNKHFSMTVDEFHDALKSLNSYYLNPTRQINSNFFNPTRQKKQNRVSDQTNDHCNSGNNVESHQKNDANTLLDKQVSDQTNDHCNSGKNVESPQKNDANTLLDKQVSDETDNVVDNFTQRSKILIPVLGMLALVPCLLFALVVTVTFLPIISLSIYLFVLL